MPTPPPPILRLDIDADALAANWRALDRLSGKASTGAAVKADCYGLGVHRCVPVLRDAGCRDFVVSHWSEVPAVLEHIPAAQISVFFGPSTRAEADYARAAGVRPVINSPLQARLWNDSGGGPCDLMVDTGINRLGLRLEDIGDPAISALEVRVLMSHLACADDDSAMNGRQLADFRAVVPRIAHQRASLANSAGIALGPEYCFDLTRPGIALYGGIPRPELAGSIQQVARPEAALVQVYRLQKGQSVGYNAIFTAPHAMRVGVVAVGYADGILRAWGNGGALHHSGRALPLLGRVSMDMVVIDLANAPDLVVGDWVEVPYSLPDAARLTGLSQYELLTLLGDRFAR